MSDESDFVKGLMLLLTSRIDECEAHFGRAINNEEEVAPVRVRASFGHALVAVVRALISFEDEDKTEALNRLIAAQKLANNSITPTGGSWFPFGSSSAPTAADKAQRTLANLDLELVSADAGLFVAMIQFTQESAMGVMRGALTLRKSYKSYQKASNEVREVAAALASPTGTRHRRGSSLSNLPVSLCADRSEVRWTSTNLLLHENDLYYDASPTEEDSLGGDAMTGYGPLIAPGLSVMDRVVASSKMGTGLFHLVFSLIPPRFSSMIGTAMGFESTADRAKGLRYLRSCVDQGTSRAPLAALVLLAFHSAMLILARGVSDEADSQEAFAVLDACLRQYPDSPLFRFFEGRLYRGRGKLRRASEAFEIAQNCSRNIHQLSYLCIYERAWCAGLSGSAREAGTLFLTVARGSSWAPAFYGYLGACFYYEQAFRILFLMPKDMKDLALEMALKSGRKANHPDEEAKQLLRQALAWFKTVPTLGKKRAPFPPEKFATMRCGDINPLATKYAISSEVNVSSSSTAGVNLDGVSEINILELSSAMFWPSLELAYFWNGFFQVENKAQLRRELEQSLAHFRQYQCLQQDLLKRHNFMSLYRLLRAAILREERNFAEADAELAQLVPNVDYSVPAVLKDKEGREKEPERWAIEFGKYERGLCNWELGDKKQALAWWNSVKDTGHPLDARLKFRLKSALRKAQSSS